MKTASLEIGQIVNYRNGGINVCTGKVMESRYDGWSYIVIEPDSEAGFILWNLGLPVGSEIRPSQLLNSDLEEAKKELAIQVEIERVQRDIEWKERISRQKLAY